jgi:hypothetical protein
MATTKLVCVWYDEAGTPDDPRWVVSLDEVDLDSGESWTSTTIHAIPDDATEDEAIKVGREIAAKRGLPLYRLEPNTDGYGLGNRHVEIDPCD